MFLVFKTLSLMKEEGKSPSLSLRDTISSIMLIYKLTQVYTIRNLYLMADNNLRGMDGVDELVLLQSE